MKKIKKIIYSILILIIGITCIVSPESNTVEAADKTSQVVINSMKLYNGSTEITHHQQLLQRLMLDFKYCGQFRMHQGLAMVIILQLIYQVIFLRLITQQFKI